MKKGCVIAIIVAVVLVIVAVVAGVIGLVVVGKKVGEGGLDFITKAPNAGAAMAIEVAIQEYKTQNPDAQIPPTNEAWAEALKDFKVGGDTDLGNLIQDGKFVDLSRNEMGFEQADDGSIKVTSPGKDGVLGTEDDVDSSMFEKLQELGEGADSQEPQP